MRTYFVRRSTHGVGFGLGTLESCYEHDDLDDRRTQHIPREGESVALRTADGRDALFRVEEVITDAGLGISGMDVFVILRDAGSVEHATAKMAALRVAVLK